jgi:N-acetylglucosamine-6-sulfatase
MALYKRLDGLRDLAAGGIEFPNAYVTTPLCCPSRISILTGQYAHTHGVLSNKPPGGGYATARDLGVESQTAAVWLQQAGYRTAFIGKYLNGYNLLEDQRTPPGWDVWHPRVKGGRYHDVVILSGGQTRKLKGYETDRYADLAERFIANTRSQPYFLYIAPYAPHAPSIPPERYADEEDPRYGSMLAVVDMIKRLRAADRDAVLMFTSDNGVHFVPEPPGKGLPIEADLHVPLFMLGVGQEVDERYALNIDLAPTLADLAGITPPSTVEGRSLLDRSWQRDTFDVEMANEAGDWLWRGTWGASPSIEWFVSPPALPPDP